MNTTQQLPSRAMANGPLFVLGPPGPSGLRPAVLIDLKRTPRYTRAKKLKSGDTAWYWSIPTWAKRQGCSLKPVALGSDRLAAFAKAEQLNVAFDRWRGMRLKRIDCAIPTRLRQRQQKATLRNFADLAAFRLSDGGELAPSGSSPIASTFS